MSDSTRSEEMAKLEQLRDEIQVKLHLAGEEAKEKWDVLEKKWLEVMDNVKASDAAHGVEHALGELKEGYGALKSKLHKS